METYLCEQKIRQFAASVKGNWQSSEDLRHPKCMLDKQGKGSDMAENQHFIDTLRGVEKQVNGARRGLCMWHYIIDIEH